MKSGRTLLCLALGARKHQHAKPPALWLLLAASFLLFSFAGTCLAEVTGNTIILMIGDGMGFKHVEITKNYVGSTLSMETLPVQVGCTTFMRGGSYNSSQAWSNFNYVKSGATDSGAAATTLATGIKTSSGRISVNHDATARLKMMTEHVRDRGWASGIITSVPFSHATPAAFGAHNNSRSNYTAIAREMITTYGDGTGAWGNTPTVDVIIGGGHPNYASGWISSTEYNALKNGTTGQGWTFVERQAGINGTTSLLNAASGATKLFGLYGGPERCIPYRLADGSGRNYENPTLVDMTVAALDVLSKNPNGRFLMIEGGSIDWAGHDNNVNRLIGEMIDFDESVAAVVDWVNTNDPTWSNTLLIVTADHETGYLTRGSGIFPNVALVNPGTGVLPTAGVHFAWNSGEHTNSLVPVYAKGAGSQLLNQYATAYDSGFGINYLDNTDIFYVMQDAFADSSPPSVPTDVQASAQSASSIQITWTASTDDVGVAGYKIFRNGLQVGTSATTSYLDTGLQPNTTYSYTVSAYDAWANNSEQSSPPAVATTLQDTSPPSAPTNVQGNAYSMTAIQLTWTASTDDVGVTGYRIYRDGSPIGTNAWPNYTDTGLQSGTTYTYTVTAYDAVGNESAHSSPPTVVTTPSVPDFCSVDLGGTDVNYYLSRVNYTTDGSTGQANIGGLNCRQPTNNTQQYFYFAINDTYIYNGSVSTTYLEVCYYDDLSETAFIEPQYDSNAGEYTSLPQTALTGTGKWKTAAWTLTDCLFANRQNGGADFRLYVGPNSVKIDSVRVGKSPFSEHLSVERDLGVNEIYSGLSHPQHTDGNTMVQLKDGVYCKKPSTAGNYFYFNVSDAVIYDGSCSVVELKVRYYDSEGGSITPEYDSASGEYTPAETLNFAGTDTWKQHTWTLTDVRFANRQNSSADFRLYVGTAQNVFIDTVVVTKVPDNEPPSTPENVRAQEITPSAIKVLWDASTDNVGVVGYNIYRNGNPVGTTDTTSFTDIGLSPQTTYSYNVSAFDAADNESDLSLSVAAATMAAINIADVKTIPDESPVGLVSQVVTAVYDGFFYIGEVDRHSGIRVVPVSMPTGLTVGSLVDIGGVLDTENNERAISSAKVVLTQTLP